MGIGASNLSHNANILFIICSCFSKSSQIVELGVCNPGSQEVEAGGWPLI